MNSAQPTSPQPWHTLDIDATLEILECNAAQGLSRQEAERRQIEYGPNELVDRGGISRWRILWGQLTSIMVLVLIVAAIISMSLGDIEDTVVILLLVVLNTAIGYQQEYKAEKSMAALKEMAVPSVRVRRDGIIQEIPAPDLVPGDIVLLEAGNRVPADGRLVTNASLQIQEAALTGESVPTTKQIAALPNPDIALGDRTDMVYAGTDVTNGHSDVVVTAIGMDTELGKIADMIQDVEPEQTPLQRRLDQLGKQLAALALIIVALVFVLGWLRGENIEVLLLTAISLAVAAVPEGLPAIVTIALSLGAQRMLSRHALIRKLPAVETLGSVTEICSDKTGTLTENRMTVTVLDVAGNRVELQGQQATRISDLDTQPALILLLAAGALCNDATPKYEDTVAAGDILGDPTEVALIVAGNRQGLSKPVLERALPRVDEIPFSSERKRMTTIHQRSANGNQAPETSRKQVSALFADLDLAGKSPYVAFTKGAVDRLMDIAGSVWINDQIMPVTDEFRSRILDANDKLAAEGLRVLGIGFRLLNQLPDLDDDKHDRVLEEELVLVGMVGIMDPARPEVRAAVQTCKGAGIHVKMITGDHPATAIAIARELTISDDDTVVTGQELDRMTAEQLLSTLQNTSVFARVAPQHKLNIVQTLQNGGEIVAMTGDGVNDAPALKQAEIGVAMGITGTDVSKEAAEMVLQDDNFATIVAAVREGRVVYANIRKFIRYLLTGNVGEIFVMLISPFLGMPLALLPLQILWINLLTDGLPALALGVEPAEGDVMRQAPRSPTESILGRSMGWKIISSGILLGLISIGIGYWQWLSENSHWQTMVFTTLTFGQMAAVLSLRSESESFFKFGIRRNMSLVGAVALTVLLQLAVLYIPLLQSAFKTQALTSAELWVCIGAGTLMLFAVEIERLITQRMSGGTQASVAQA